MKTLLGTCCGLAGTEVGSIDFTGCWFLEEPWAVFRPALTLAIDDAERRWIAEVGDKELPGPVWCVFSHPEVTIYVSDDLSDFMATLRERACRGEMGAWLQNLTAQARAVWSQRHALAIRPHEAAHSDRSIRGWLLALPSDAYVYDLRRRSGGPLGSAVSLRTATGVRGRRFAGGRLAGARPQGSDRALPRGSSECRSRLRHRDTAQPSQASSQAGASGARVVLEPTSIEPFAWQGERGGGGTAVRMNAFKRLRGAALWIGMALLLCAFAPEAVAGALQAMTPSVWGAAAALGLALITVMNGDQK
jgi:hypothetical protein